MYISLRMQVQRHGIGGVDNDFDDVGVYAVCSSSRTEGSVSVRLLSQRFSVAPLETEGDMYRPCTRRFPPLPSRTPLHGEKPLQPRSQRKARHHHQPHTAPLGRAEQAGSKGLPYVPPLPPPRPGIHPIWSYLRSSISPRTTLARKRR